MPVNIDEPIESSEQLRMILTTAERSVKPLDSDYSAESEKTSRRRDAGSARGRQSQGLG
ncbi:MAG: hypothetical protein NVSMB14_01640 [Isosphaeraceae bacterium]